MIRSKCKLPPLQKRADGDCAVGRPRLPPFGHARFWPGGLPVPPCLPLSLALLWSAASLGRCFALPSLSVPLALAGASVPSLASACAVPPFQAGLAAPFPAAASPPALAFLRAAPLLLPRRGTDARARPRSPTAFVPRRERVFCRCGGEECCAAAAAL